MSWSRPLFGAKAARLPLAPFLVVWDTCNFQLNKASGGQDEQGSNRLKLMCKARSARGQKFGTLACHISSETLEMLQV